MTQPVDETVEQLRAERDQARAELAQIYDVIDSLPDYVFEPFSEARWQWRLDHSETFDFGGPRHIIGARDCSACYSDRTVDHRCAVDGCLEHNDEDAFMGDLCGA